MDRDVLQLDGVRPVIRLLLLLSLLQAAAAIVQASFLARALAQLFDAVPAAAISGLLTGLMTAVVVRHTAVLLQRRMAGRFAERASERIREELLEAVIRNGPAAAAAEGTGTIVTLAMDGIDRLRVYLETVLPRTIDMAAVTVVLLLWIYRLDWISGLVLSVTLPVLIAFFVLLGRMARTRADRQWRSYRMLAHHFTDTLRGLPTLRFLGRSRGYARTIREVSDRYRQASMRLLRVAFLSSFALDFFAMLSIASVAVGLGLRLVDGGIGLETALAVLLLSPEYFVPVRMLGSDFHASLDGKEAWAAIRALKLKQPVRPAEDPVIPEPAPADDLLLRGGAGAPLVRLAGVRVKGDDGASVLHDLTLEIPPAATRIGIAGASGSGKSTLLSLLAGFREPDAGTISLRGQSLEGDARARWRRQIAYLPQHPHLFSCSLADNIRFYSPDAPRERVEQMIDRTGLRALVESLPSGIDEPIGEGGRSLSGGQAQRISLARALLSERPILLLDEPTSQLDIETELELKTTILSVFRDRTLILATHRLHWMAEMDWVWVMDKGRLAECGSYEELVRRRGLFCRLAAVGMEEWKP